MATSVSWAARAAAGSASRDLDDLRRELSSGLAALGEMRSRHAAALAESERFLRAASAGPAAVAPAELAQEVLADSVEVQAVAPAAGAAAAKMELVNSSLGLTHKVLVGPNVVPLDQCVSMCGWKFGGSSAKVVWGHPPLEYRKLCARCQSRKDVLAAAVRGVQE